MADRRYMVGERALVSREETGMNHEEATVVDYYELLINEDTIPSVVVDFDGGERRYLTAREPNVLELPDRDEDEWEDEDADDFRDDVDEDDGDGSEGDLDEDDD
jgi:hypothetical protein